MEDTFVAVGNVTPGHQVRPAAIRKDLLSMLIDHEPDGIVTHTVLGSLVAFSSFQSIVSNLLICSSLHFSSPAQLQRAIQRMQPKSDSPSSLDPTRLIDFHFLVPLLLTSLL